MSIKPLVLSLFVCVVACDKDNLALEDDLIVSDEERELMTKCQEDQLTSVAEITENLVGEWNLVGYGCGFCSPHSAPRIQLMFADNGTGTMVALHEGEPTGLEFTWKIEKENSSQGQLAQNRLVTEPTDYRLSAAVFCKRYMWYNHTPVDGHMLLYRKR